VEQTSIPVPEPQPSAQACQWCLEAIATTTLEVEKPRFSSKRGSREMMAPAKRVPVCQACADRLAPGIEEE
jgi:hypothetical protein